MAGLCRAAAAGATRGTETEMIHGEGPNMLVRM